jgi:transcriptional regulator of met regulon
MEAKELSISKNVIKSSDAESAKQKAREVEAQLLCEAMAKDDPSPEAKVYRQERFEEIPAAYLALSHFLVIDVSTRLSQLNSPVPPLSQI